LKTPLLDEVGAKNGIRLVTHPQFAHGIGEYLGQRASNCVAIGKLMNSIFGRAIVKAAGAGSTMPVIWPMVDMVYKSESKLQNRKGRPTIMLRRRYTEYDGRYGIDPLQLESPFAPKKPPPYQPQQDNAGQYEAAAAFTSPVKEKTVFHPVMPDFAFTNAIKSDLESTISVMKQQLTWVFYMFILLIILVVIVLMMQIMMFMKSARINSAPLY
jgi:hypothetical protein